MFKNLRKKKKGFTLIELIIVIAIIAILAAVALPKFGSVKESAKDKADLANAKTIFNVATALYEDGKLKDETSPIGVIADSIIDDDLQEIPKTSAGNNFYVEFDTTGITGVFDGNADGAKKIYPQ